MQLRLIIFLCMLVLTLSIFNGCKMDNLSYSEDDVLRITELYAAKEKLHGKVVSVIGRIYIGWEVDRLESCSDDESGSMLHLNLVNKKSASAKEKFELLNKKHEELKHLSGDCVIISGVFDKEMAGHLSSHPSGGLKNITNIKRVSERGSNAQPPTDPKTVTPYHLH